MSNYVSNKKTKFGRALDTDWHNMWQEDNLGSTITGLVGGLGNAVGTGITTSQIQDTDNIEAEYNAIGNTQFSTGSYDNLLAQFDVNNMANTNLGKEDLMLYTPGQQVGNVLLAGVNGFLGSNLGANGGKLNKFAGGGIISGLFNAGLNMAGAGIGALVANNKATKEANRLNLLAEEVNQQYLNNFNNAVSNTQNTMFNNSLLNIASYGGPLFDLSGEFSNGLTFINEGGSHEANPFGGVMVGVDQEGTPNLVEEGEIIFNDYVFSNRLKPTKKQLADGGFTDKYNDWTFAKIVEDLQKESSERPNDIISKAGLDDMMSRVMMMQEEIRMKKENKNNIYARGGNKHKRNRDINWTQFIGSPLTRVGKDYMKENPEYYHNPIYNSDTFRLMDAALGLPIYMERETDELINEKIEEENAYFNELEESFVKGLNIKPTSSTKSIKEKKNANSKDLTDKSTETTNKLPWQSALRYASPIAHGITLLNNLKKPDYSNADRIESAARAIPGGSFTPIGDYLNLQEVDQNVLVNPILANAAANRRAIQNQGLNAGQTIAGLTTSNYTDNNAIGNALIQGIQANNQIKSTEAQFNRGTNQANAQMGLQALAMDQQRAQNILNATTQASQLRNQLDALRSQAISGSLTGIADDLGSIGRESIDLHNYNKLIDLGYIPKGWSANGGMLTRKRRRK